MAKYTFGCNKCYIKKTIELGYDSEVPKELLCRCGNSMPREYKPTVFHLKGTGWGSDKTGEK